jgi:hypothetical protein
LEAGRVYAYNLILYHMPKRLGITDFMTIRNMMVGRAPDIEVHILSASGVVPAEFWRMVAARPTLIFSPSYLVRIDASVRGARLISKAVGKLAEIEVLASTGVAVPETRLIKPEMRLDEKEWGPYTVIKPSRGLRGRGISLMRTRNVRWIDTSILPVDDPRHGLELMAQRYVDTGPFPTCYRVFTVLGRPIYCMRSTALDKPSELDANGAESLDLAVAANSMRRKLELTNDSDIIELASSVHAKLPHLPVMGIDIIREKDTGRLFTLEYNSGGGVWHLSSNHGLKHQHEFQLDYYGQFDALGTITDALIETTRKLAA